MTGPEIPVEHSETFSGGATYPHLHTFTATHPDGSEAKLSYMLSKRNTKGVVDRAYIPKDHAHDLGVPLVRAARAMHPGAFVKGLPGLDEDWGQHLPSVTSIHRNLTLKLEPADRDFIHDESVPKAKRAAHIMGLMAGRPSMHWASQRGRAAADKFGDHDFRSPEHTQVAISAHPPSPEHVETDPERISKNGGYAYQAPDWEVPLKEGAPVHASSVRWRTGDSGWTQHRFGGGHSFTAARQREGDTRPHGDGYLMKYRTEDKGERKPRHVIETFHGGDRVGELSWYGTTGVIHHLNVAGEEDQRESGLGNGQEHQRKGIATAMWNWGQEMTPKPRHSEDRTNQGDAWAKSVGGPRPRMRRTSEYDYRGRHQGPGPDEEDGDALHEIGSEGSLMFPANVHESPHIYGGRHPETVRAIRRAKGNPEAKVMMYRGLPEPHADINPGDWVGLSAAYARRHAESEGRPGRDWHVIKHEVPAKHLRTEGNSLEEWTYQGPPVKATVHERVPTGPRQAAARMLDLYHHTTPEAADEIMRTRKMHSAESAYGQPEAFFTTDPSAEASHAGGRGLATVHIRVPEHLARVEDEFPSGEEWHAVQTRSLRPEHFIGRTAAWHEAADRAEYGGQHSPISYHSPLHQLDDEESSLGRDPYSRVGEMQERGRIDGPSARQVLKARGKPDEMVTIHRAAPHPHVGEFNPGDWVSLSRGYARGHARMRGPDYDVASVKVPAKHVRAGGDWQEWGYWGPPIKPGQQHEAARHEAEFNPVTGWGRDKPHAAAISEAQERTRLDHPTMTMRLPEPNRWGQSEDGAVTLRGMLRRGGYPEDKAEGAWVAQRPESATASATGYDAGDRTPGVGLHPQRWDYGTMAHEAAHLLHNHERGLHPATTAGQMGYGDEEVHGPDFARHYEGVIRSSWGHEAGDDFRRHHDDARVLVSNFRSRVHQLPRIDDGIERPRPEPLGAGQHEGALHMAADQVPPEPGATPIPHDHIRLWHYTPGENADSIREHGILRNRAHSDAMNDDPSEPSYGVWASTKKPDDMLHSDSHAAVVEFHAHPDEISGQAESPWQHTTPEARQEWAKGYHHVIMRGDVKPSQIVHVHQGWEHAYHYMKNDDPKSYGWIRDDMKKPGNEHLAPYARALDVLDPPSRHMAARRMTMAEILDLKPGDYPEHATVRDALPDIHEKISDDYEDAGEGMRERMARGIQPGDLTVNQGRLDDGHRRAAIAHQLGWTSMAVRSGKIPRKESSSFTHRYETYGSGPEGGYVHQERTVEGPFYHGGRARGLGPGDMLTPGRKTNSWGDEGTKASHIHFTTSLPGAASYASQVHGGGHVYEVEPTGEVAGGYDGAEWKSRHPLRVVRKLDPQEWSQHRTAGSVSHWQHRDCGVYAKALTDADPSLRIGAVAGPHSNPEEGHALHWFAHDDTHAYDSRGRHPLPYVSVWDSAARDWFPPESHKSMGFKQVLDVDHSHFGDLTDEQAGMLPAARRHIRQNRILDRDGEHTAAWDDDEDEEEFDHPEYGNYDDIQGRYHHPEKGWRCSTCDDFHDDAGTANSHETSHTDWERIHPHLPDEMHRGFAAELPHGVHEQVHDSSASPAARAHLLAGAIGTQHGTHWSPTRSQAKHYATISAYEHANSWDKASPHLTEVMLHARKPEMHHIETDPDELESQNVIGFEHHDDAEIPLRRRAPVHLTGVSWRRNGEDAWQHHDFGEPLHHTAALRPGLPNPHTGGQEWFHGTQAHHEELGGGGGFADPASVSSDAYDMPEEEGGGHWNALLGTHFTADHEVADEFAKGEHASGDNERHDWGGRSAQKGVVHARLHIANPKHYDSEHDMDHEAYEEEFRRGNHPSNHWEDDEDDDYTAEAWPTAHGIREKYGNDKIPKGDYGNPGDPYARESHPTRTAWLNAHPDKWGIADRFKKRLQARGHDGITYGNEYEKSSHGQSGNRSAIAFHPDQVDIAQHHTAGQPCMSAEEGELHQLRLPGRGQHELPFPQGARTAAAWSPSHRIFGPTYGLDHRLFSRGRLRPAVRQAVMERLDQALRVDQGVFGSDWQDFTRVYLAGSEASEWTSPQLEGNGDFDTLLGLDFTEARARGSRLLAGLTDMEIADRVNDALRVSYNDPMWHPPFDQAGSWDLTGFCNTEAWDIRDIHPYAAWDLTSSSWAVRPPHLPAWTPDQFPAGPALMQEARAVAAQVRAILRLPEPYRTQEATALWDKIHTDRTRAFSGPQAQGWQDPGNVIEKFLDQHPHHLLDKLRGLKFATAAAGGDGPGQLRRPSADEFMHDVPAHDSWLDQFRVHREKYLLHDADSSMITAYRIGQHGLAHPGAQTDHPKPRRAGYLTWFGGKPRRKDDGTLDDSSNINGGVIHKVVVSGPHRRKGVASAMLAFARELHPEQEIRHSHALSDDGRAWAEHTATADWADHQGKNRLYLRFGHWPENERSENHVMGGHEEGVSVYDLDRHGDPEDPDPHFQRGHQHDEGCEPDCDLDQWDHEDYGNDTRDEMLGRVNRAERGRASGREHPADTGHLVKGEMVGLGHDAEPLLNNVRRVGDWIDHRHLLIPGAEKHRLARDEDDEDYKPPPRRPQPRAPRTAAATKTKAEVNYRWAPHGVRPCQDCVMFSLHAPDFETGACTLVKGMIDVQGTCDRWSPAKTGRTAAVRMVPPEEYEKYEYPDYKYKTLPRLAQHIRETYPEHYEKLRADISANGVQSPMLVRYGNEHGQFRRPQAMDGHHRAAIAHELGQHIPVGDYDDDNDYDESMSKSSREWQLGAPPGWHKKSSKGEGYVTCGQDHRHWGEHGAAGLLVRAPADDGYRYLLHKRGDSSDHPGTWSIPGGALHADETPIEGARREAGEELGKLPDGLKHHHTVTDDHGGWQYHTVIQDAPECFTPAGGGSTGHETAGYGWFTSAEMKHLPLHPGFEKTWNTVRNSRTDKTAGRRAADPPYSGPYFGHAEREGTVEERAARRTAARWPAHWYKPPEQRAGEPGEHMYRRQMPGYLGDTLQHGLAPRPSAGMLPDDPEKAVYMTTDDHAYHARREHGTPGSEAWAREHPHGSMLKIDVSGLPLTEDRTYTTPGKSKRGWMATGHIPPERIRPHVPGTDHGVTYDDWPEGSRTAGYDYDRVYEHPDQRRRRGVEPGEFYHGTNVQLSPGDSVEPGHEPVFPGASQPNEVYYTRDPRAAMEYANSAVKRKGTGEPHVYRVTKSDHHPRQDFNDENGLYSHAPLRVKHEWFPPQKTAAAPEYLHGTRTRFSPGDILTPQGERAANWTDDDDDVAGQHVHITTSRPSAEMYAYNARTLGLTSNTDPIAPARVYQVEPHGPLADDPNDDFGAHRVQRARVIREVGHDEADRGRISWHGQRTAMITPGSLPPEQQAAFDVDDLRSHRNQMLDVAKNPAPGTRVWRGELRPEGEHPSEATSVGMHWSVNPDSIIGRADQRDHWKAAGLRPVVWQGVVENHEEQAFPRSHPMWRGRHESFGHEAEVRFKPGARVKLEGAYTHDPDPESPHEHNYLVPQIPERTSPNWKWHQLDHHVTIAHKPGNIGSSDYSELGIPKEGARHTAAGSGMMVALVPADDVKDHLQQVMEPLGRHQAEERDQLHVTVLYLGKPADFTDAELDKMPELIRMWAKTAKPFTAAVQGAGTFANAGEHPLIALVDVPGEARHLHNSLADFLKGHGIKFPENHSWIPHVTLAYSPQPVRFLPKVERREWPVTEVHYCRNGRWTPFPLGRP